jgi:hypothetical protein
MLAEIDVITKKDTRTAAYAIDLGVTLSFMWSLDATLRLVTFLRDWESLAAFDVGSFS